MLAGEEYSVVPSERSDGKNFSATDLRQLISNLVVNPQDLESLRQLTEYIPEDKINKLYGVLGLPSPVNREELEEESGAGAAGGFGWPLGAPPPRRGKNKTKKRKLETENKQTVDDVIRLLMERGIMS